jgi:hypothetical protein
LSLLAISATTLQGSKYLVRGLTNYLNMIKFVDTKYCKVRLDNWGLTRAGYDLNIIYLMGKTSLADSLS